jgi:erythromycin esterase-like protein
MFALAIAVTIGATALAEETIPDLPPYPLPAEARKSLTELAETCDVLILGETHGTQQVPAIAETLLDPLTKLNYRTIALEVPYDQQPAIEAWATGKTDVVPSFFARPGSDGRGNREVLALVRRALRPPQEWKLICFDQTEQEMMRQMTERLPKGGQGTIAEQAAKLSPNDFVALSVARDAAMAEQLAAATTLPPKGNKVLAICGNLHARTANHAPPESQIAALWPSFAAQLAMNQPALRVQSINFEAYGGEYFNGGKVSQFTSRPLDKVELRPTPNGQWDWVLRFPEATVATFLQPPHN